MSYTYTTFVAALATELVVPQTDTDFNNALPQIIDDAEQRCYRDVDLLSTVVSDVSGVTTPNNRYFYLPQALGRFVVVEGINVLVSGVQYPLTPVSREALPFLWPSNTAPSGATIPSYYAMLSDQTLLLGPSPGAAFSVEVIGTIRPNALASGNPTTPLSLYLSDLFFAAAMVSAAGYLKNYGAQADEPRQAVSWEMMYQARLASAKVEEARKKYGASSWSPKAPVAAQPERG